ncbi:OB-fold domain-containing protein [Aurantivibrio infirmus]
MSNTVNEPFDEQGPDLVYQNYLEDGQFKIQHCLACDSHVFYPRLICSHCGSEKMEWIDASGSGVVYSTSIPRGAKEGDYNISLVDLDEGPRMMTRVVDIEPEKVTIGMKVTAFVSEIDGTKVVLFKPEGGQ